VNTPVNVVFDPVVMFAGLAPKLVIEGAAAFTVTVAIDVAGVVPLAPVTVSV